MGVEACLESSLTLAKSLLCCNFHSLKACLEACLEACLILAKCLFCSTFHSITGNFHSLDRGLPRGLPHPSQACLSFAAISIASRLILAKSLLCCNFHSLACLEACLEACLILAKCLFCSTFHRIYGNVHSLEACLEACHPSQLSVLLHFLSHPWQFLAQPSALSIASMAISIASRPAKSLLCCNFHSILWQFP